MSFVALIFYALAVITLLWSAVYLVKTGTLDPLSLLGTLVFILVARVIDLERKIDD